MGVATGCGYIGFLIPTPLVFVPFYSSIPTFCSFCYHRVVDSISRDEPDSPLTQYITNARISCARYIITLFKYHHRVLRLISNRISV